MCCRPAWMWCSCTALGLTDVCRKAVRSFGCPQQPCPAPQPVGCVPSVWELPLQPEQCWPEEQLGTGQLWGTWQLNTSHQHCSSIIYQRLETESIQALSKRNIPNRLQPFKPVSQGARQPESSKLCQQTLSRMPNNTFFSPIQFLCLNSSD